MKPAKVFECTQLIVDGGYYFESPRVVFAESAAKAAKSPDRAGRNVVAAFVRPLRSREPYAAFTRDFRADGAWGEHGRLLPMGDRPWLRWLGALPEDAFRGIDAIVDTDPEQAALAAAIGPEVRARLAAGESVESIYDDVFSRPGMTVVAEAP